MRWCLLAGAEWMSSSCCSCSTPPAFLPPALRTLFHTLKLSKTLERNLPPLPNKEKQRKSMKLWISIMVMVMVQVTAMDRSLNDLRPHGIFFVKHHNCLTFLCTLSCDNNWMKGKCLCHRVYEILVLHRMTQFDFPSHFCEVMLLCSTDYKRWIWDYLL